MRRIKATGLTWLILLAVALAACTPAASPTPTPPPKPAAAPTTAPAAKPAAPTTAPAPTAAAKPAAQTSPAAKPAALTPLNPPVTLRVGLLKQYFDSPIYLADKKGFFNEVGVKLDIQKFDTGAQMVAPLGSALLDIGLGAPSAGLYNAIQRGIPLKAVADGVSASPGASHSSLVIRKDLADKVKDFKDLRGLKLATAGTGGTADEVTLTEAAKKGGMTIKDINVVTMPFPDQLAAFSGKTIDGSIMLEPLVVKGINDNLIVRFKLHDEIYPGHQIVAVMYAPSFAEKQPEAARRFMVAYLKGVRVYNDAVFKNKNKDEVLKPISEWSNNAPEVLAQASLGRINPDGYLNVKSMQFDQDVHASNGLVKEKVDLSKVVDNQYVDYALGILGKYE